MSILEDTDRVLREARESANSIIVAYSGGKDSRVVMDLCVRNFTHVKAFFMEFIPNLDSVELELDEARARWGVEIVKYPHWIARKAIAMETYTNSWYEHDTLPEWNLQDVYAIAMLDLQIGKIATGAKASDSAWRRRFMSTFKPKDVINPIASWMKYDVISYLKAHGIPVPESSGHSATGIDLSVPSLLWLHDQHPQDFDRLLRVFPFAQAVVERRRLYGIAA